MRVLVQALALSLPLLAASRAGQISGTVVSAQGGEPLASVELTLSPVASNPDGEQNRGPRGPRGPGGPGGPGFRSGLSARTSLDGRFVFDSVDAGEYVIGASKAGFDGGGRVARRVSLPESAPSASVSIELNRSPALEGRVIDADGDPLAQARVELRAWTMADGRRMLRAVRFAQTDDRGEYRVYNLSPGQYLVYLNPTSLGAMPGGVIYETSGAYYPHGAAPAEAAKLNLDWGTELKGVDFVASAAGGSLVSGTLLREDGTVCNDCSVTILDAIGLAVAGTRASGAGRFAVHGLPSAEYTFAARAPRGGGLALEKVYLPDGRPVELALRLTPGQSVSGSVSVENARDGEEITLERAAIRLLPADPTLAGHTMGARIRAEGGFTIDSVPQGVYRAAVFGIPANGYISHARLGGSELPDGLLRVTGDGPVSGIELVASLDGGSVQGRAMGRDGESPAPPDGMVLLIPLRSDAVSRQEQITGYRGSAVSFRFSGVAPGEYLVFSAPRTFAWDWSDPALMAELRRRAARVEVRKGGSVEADAPFLDGP